MEFVEMINIIRGGGWVMILLAVLALILYITAFDLLYFAWSGNLGKKSEASWLDWIRQPEQGEGMTGDIIRYSQGGGLKPESIEQRFSEIRSSLLSRIDQRLVLLKTLVGAAPLAGLLGTVIGMLTTFDGISKQGGETVDKIAAGISEALITTQTGLIIALPGVFVLMIIQRRRDALDAAVGRLLSLTMVHRTGGQNIQPT
ncbi:MAG: MotA/TolQ/ExbB proton channel family protein [Verrucomicrobiota bacterium]